MYSEAPNPRKRMMDQSIDYHSAIEKSLTASKQQIQDFFQKVTPTESKVKSEFSCQICKQVIYQPRQCDKCSAKYCKLCADKHVDKNDDYKNPPKCFKCSKPLNCGNINPNSFQKLNGSMMSFQVGGNAVTIPYIDVAKYFSENIFRKEMPCPLECGHKFDNLEDAKRHFETCPHKLTQCKGCLAVHPYAEAEAHDAVCPEREVECPDKCGMFVKRKDMDEHMKVCLGELYTCEKCGGKVNMKNKDNHICQNYLLNQLITQFNKISEMMMEDRQEQDVHEDCLIMGCRCSTYCYHHDKVLTKNSPVVNKKCGVYCPKCNMVICKKCPGFQVNNLGNAVCFDCRKICVKTDQEQHYCVNFRANCVHCCRNFNHEIHSCKTCGGEACWTCKVVFNEGMNGYYRVNSCGIVDGDKMCKKIVRLADDHKESDVYRHSRYFYCKKHDNQIFW